MRVISLGWGVQSWALAAMSALGVLPPIDAAIHADTGHERSETYAFAEKWTPWLEARGVRVVTVDDGRRKMMDEWGGLSIPARSTWPDGRPSGLLHRQCTNDWKIAPMRRWLQKHRFSYGLQVEQWLGITLDEVARMKPSGVKYIKNAFPFIEMFDLLMSRWQVVQWLQDTGLEVPVKSSCVFCPYHDRATWRNMKMNGNSDWSKAVEVDEMIRHKRDGYVCYLTSALKPLDETDFRSQEDHGQLSLWDEECEGMCFL